HDTFPHDRTPFTSIAVYSCISRLIRRHAEKISQRTAERRATTANQSSRAEGDRPFTEHEPLHYGPAVRHLEVAGVVCEPISAGADQYGVLGHPSAVRADERG